MKLLQLNIQKFGQKCKNVGFPSSSLLLSSKLFELHTYIYLCNWSANLRIVHVTHGCMTADYTELLSTNLWEVKLISMSRISFGEMICPSRIILLKTTNKFHLHHHFFHFHPCSLWHKMQTLIRKNERLSVLEHRNERILPFILHIWA